MYYKSKKISLFILLLTAIMCSSVVTLLFDDPVNRTLINALTFGILLYFLSLATYLFDPSRNLNDISMMSQVDSMGVSILEYFSFISFIGLKRLLFTVAIQIIIGAGFFLYWN